MARRNIKIDLRLNEQEMERLRRDVARSGWSREKYLRALIDKSVIKEMPSMDLVAVLRNLQQINNNILILVFIWWHLIFKLLSILFAKQI